MQKWNSQRNAPFETEAVGGNRKSTSLLPSPHSSVREMTLSPFFVNKEESVRCFFGTVEIKGNKDKVKLEGCLY